MQKKSKSSKQDILELPNRKKLYRIVLKYAGSHFRKIERISRLPTGIVKYHLDYLSRHDIIRQEKIGNNIRYFPKELFEEEKRLLSLLRSKSIRKIIICLISNGYSTNKDIADFAGLSPSTISWYLKKLLNEEIIETKKENETVLYKLKIEKSIIMKLLITYKESFFDSLVNKTIEMWR